MTNSVTSVAFYDVPDQFDVKGQTYGTIEFFDISSLFWLFKLRRVGSLQA